jgi:RNA polymerase sigma-70 factor, ECF subfamily
MPDPNLERAFLGHRRSLLRRLARLVGCRDTAEDLMQDTWIRAASVGAVASPAAFLHRVALNLARDHLRHAAVQGPLSMTALDGLACTEPRRVSRRLLILRGWSHDEATPTLLT